MSDSPQWQFPGSEEEDRFVFQGKEIVHVRHAFLNIGTFPGGDDALLQAHGAVSGIEQNNAFYLGARLGEPNSQCA